MGLSNEERILKFFWAASGWRKALYLLANKVGDERVNYTDERAENIVKGWIRELDWMVGYVQQARGNPGNVFWLLGEGDDTLQGLLSDPYGIEQDLTPQEVVFDEPKYETVRWWAQEADYAFTARRLQFPPFQQHEKLEALALWWDAYKYMGGVAYPLFRYDDKLFGAEMNERFFILCGQIINRRFEVCFGGEDSKNMKTERYLLWKHAAFHTLLLEAEGKLKRDDYFKKRFDGYALYEQVAKMEPKDLHEMFERVQKQKDARERKFRDDRAKREPKPDGLFGTKPTPTQEGKK